MSKPRQKVPSPSSKKFAEVIQESFNLPKSTKKPAIHEGAFNHQNNTILQNYQSPVVINTFHDLVEVDIPLYSKYMTEYFERCHDLMNKKLSDVKAKRMMRETLGFKKPQSTEDGLSPLQMDLKYLFAYHRRLLLDMFPAYSLIHDRSTLRATNEALLIFSCMCLNLLIQVELDEELLTTVDANATDCSYKHVVLAGMSSNGPSQKIYEYTQRQLKQAWDQLCQRCEFLELDDPEVRHDYTDYRSQLLFRTAEMILTCYPADSLETKVLFNMGYKYNHVYLDKDTQESSKITEVSMRFQMEIMFAYVLSEFNLYFKKEVLKKRLLDPRKNGTETTINRDQLISTLIRKFLENCNFKMSGNREEKRRKHLLIYDIMIKQLKEHTKSMAESINNAPLLDQIVQMSGEAYAPLGYKIEARFKNDLIMMTDAMEQRQQFFTSTQYYYLNSGLKTKLVPYFLDEELNMKTLNIVFNTCCMLLEQNFLNKHLNLPWSKECVLTDRNLWLMLLPTPKVEKSNTYGNYFINDTMGYVPERHHYFERDILEKKYEPLRVMEKTDTNSIIGSKSDNIEQYEDQEGNIRYRNALPFKGAYDWLNYVELDKLTPKQLLRAKKKIKKHEYWKKMREMGVIENSPTGTRKLWLVPLDLRAIEGWQMPMIVKFGSQVYVTVIEEGPKCRLMELKYKVKKGEAMLSACEAFIIWNLQVLQTAGSTYHRGDKECMDVGFMQPFIKNCIKEGLLNYCYNCTTTDNPHWKSDQEEFKSLYHCLQHRYDIADVQEDDFALNDLASLFYEEDEVFDPALLERKLAEMGLDPEDVMEAHKIHNEMIGKMFVTMDDAPNKTARID